MNNKVLYVVSGIWVIFFIGIYGLGLFEHPQSFNELGDFLAGVFAPLGFLWLIYGYRQQGKQLEQNSIAINQQAEALQQQVEALNFQLDEMKVNVKQQAELLKLQKNQFERELKKVEPLLVVDNISFEYLTNEYDQEAPCMIILTFKIKNLGQVANEFYIRDHLKRAIYSKEQIAYKEVISVSLQLTQEHFFNESNSSTYSADIPFDFENTYGVPTTLNYEAYIELSRDDDIEDKVYIFRKL